jgi:uncharacterized membrane protein YdbT with pleckstrin-like domain
MSYLRDNLRPGEKVVLEARLTPLGLWIWGVFFCLPAALFIMSATVERWSPGFLIGILWSMPFVYAYLRYKRTEMGVTDRRVVEKRGVFAESTRETPLDKIQTVTFKRSMLGKMFDYGTVAIQSAATFGIEGMEHLRHPRIVRDAVLRQIELYHTRLVREQAEAIAKATARQ